MKKRGRRGRQATEREIHAAMLGISDLNDQKLRIDLVPAPNKMHSSHKIRIISSKNPDWYSDYAFSMLERGARPRRERVKRWLQRIIDTGYVKPYPWSHCEIVLKMLVDKLDTIECSEFR